MTIYKNKHPLDIIKILNELINKIAKEVNFTEIINLEINYNINPKNTKPMFNRRF